MLNISSCSHGVCITMLNILAQDEKQLTFSVVRPSARTAVRRASSRAPSSRVHSDSSSERRVVRDLTLLACQRLVYNTCKVAEGDTEKTYRSLLSLPVRNASISARSTSCERNPCQLNFRGIDGDIARWKKRECKENNSDR
jgi:hypothetical protein